MSDRKQYLGDAVYVDTVDHDMIVLTTEDGRGGSFASNRIYLDWEVQEALLRYLGAERK